jgi:hypothetical protein
MESDEGITSTVTADANARGICRVCGSFSQKRRRHLPRPARSSTPDEGSPTRIGGASRATLTGDRAVNGGPVSEQIEQTRLDSGGDPGEPLIPLTEQHAQLVAQLGEVAKARLQFGEPVGDQRADAPARGAATVTLRQDARQFVKGEANRQRSPHESYTCDGLMRIAAIAAPATSRGAEHTLALVMAQRVRADAGQARQFRGAEHCVTFAGVHTDNAWFMDLDDRSSQAGTAGVDNRTVAGRTILDC